MQQFSEVPIIDDPYWREVLLTGHANTRRLQKVFRFLPSTPRCKACFGPFGGIGGLILKPFGIRPSRKNPRMCVMCCEHMPAGGAEVDVAVLFADVRGSTGLGERLGARELAALLNKFYRVATEVLVAHDGIIDKLIGDEVMALFLPGVAGPEYRRIAIDAAIALNRALGYGSARGPLLPVGIGVHAGEAFVGNVGSDGVTDFTAIGDTVNTAARLQAQAASGAIAISGEMFPAVAGRFPNAMPKRLTLRGKESEMDLYIVVP